MDHLDGCQVVLDAAVHDDGLTALLRPLFPAGQADAYLADEWLELFGDCGLPDLPPQRGSGVIGRVMDAVRPPPPCQGAR